MITMGVFPFQGKTHMVKPGIEPGTSWLVVRRLVILENLKVNNGSMDWKKADLVLTSVHQGSQTV